MRTHTAVFVTKDSTGAPDSKPISLYVTACIYVLLNFCINAHKWGQRRLLASLSHCAAALKVTNYGESTAELLITAVVSRMLNSAKTILNKML